MGDSGVEFSFEWEERAEEVPYRVHMIAGSIAGLSEHTLLLPLDNLKTHLQTKSPNLGAAFSEIVSRGPLSFYRGSSIIALGCVPSHALFFMNFEYMKRRVSNQNTHIDFLGNMVVGSSATVFHDLIMTPCEMIKQRSQLLNLPYLAIMKHSYQKEGLLSFWRSFPVNFMGSIPNGTVFVAANENLKTLYRRYVSDLTLTGHFICASISGMISALLTSPLDNIKTRLNVQQVHIESILKHQETTPVRERGAGRGGGLGAWAYRSAQNLATLRRAFRKDGAKVNQCKCRELPVDRKQSGLIKYPNAWCAVKIIRKEEGVRGFFKGASMRMGTQSLSSAIAWSIYEYSKRLLTSRAYK